MSETTQRCASVAIIGRPNAGKSTLMNAILGTHLSIVAPKPQTTRKRVLGILTEGDSQLIFIDTPGILRPQYKLQRSMMGFVGDAVDEADILCIVIDVEKAVERGSIMDPMIMALLERSEGRPAVLVFNKMDALKNKPDALPLMEEARLSGKFAKAIAISAQDGTYVEDLLQILRELSPQMPFLYDEEQLSTQPERFFVAELVREAIFHQFQQEIPYSTEVVIAEFKERENGKWYVAADIVVERETQKAILIGAKGSALKQVGEAARASIEKHLDQPVYLELFVKVRRDWRNDRSQLASFGYS
jgi:GTP-binding protein Era